MARPAPGPIPRPLPDQEQAARLIEKFVNAPRVVLGDATLRNLIETYSDGTPVWLTGSSVWMPAVFSMDPPSDNDYDLVFSTQAACDRFVNGFMAEMNARVPGFTYKKGASQFGATRIFAPDNSSRVRSLGNIFAQIQAGAKGIVDAWALEPGESIAEVLMSYKENYQRCAYLMNRSVAGSAGALTRIVRPVSKAAFETRY